ncbi:MAG: ATP-binding protein [Lachnospiraceae bacterium]|jgi:predicted AAA+ superfamily ATPase|nr:ATP-binding protein [Lachnospiraceae bacterium]
MYIPRTLEAKLNYLAEHFPIVMVCGARQVGKTTLLNQLKKGPRELQYVTLDYPRLRSLAREDPELFLQQYQAPLIIDEIQYAPELLPYIKIRADQVPDNGLYYLTGSQMFHMMKNVSESLAGRVGILSMYSLSRAEIEGRASVPFLPGRIPMARSADTITGIFEKIYRGGMPPMITDPDLLPEDYFGAYMQTYLERDIRDLVAVKDENKFLKFISCAAARSGQEVNLADMAKDVEIDRKTADGWLSILVSSGIMYLLPPYSGNIIKRIVKRPKLYFMDTGLACYLSLWNNPRALELSAVAGAMFENYVVSEIIKSYANQGISTRGRLCYYRDNNGKEIDLMILQNGKIYPVEIKKSADPGKSALKNFSVLDSLPEETGEGAVICMTPMVIPLDEKNKLVPVACI